MRDNPKALDHLKTLLSQREPEYARAEYVIDAVSYTKVQGKPFQISEIVARLQQMAG